MKVILSGLGNMGKNHLRNLHELSDLCTLNAIVDKDEEKLNIIKNNYPNLKIFTNLDKALDEIEPDAVIIATPTSTHFDSGIKVLERGIPLLMEKPIASTTELAQKLINEANKKNTPFMIGHVERFNPAVVSAFQILSKKELGDVVSISTRRVGGMPRDINAAGNVLVDLAVHDIDIVSWLLNTKVKLITALGRKKNSIDSAILLGRANDTTVDIHVNWITPAKERMIKVTGTKGLLQINLISQQVLWVKQNPLLLTDESNSELKPHNTYFTDYIKSFSQPDQIEIGIQKREPLKEELRAFLTSVASKSTEMPISAQDGFNALSFAESARKIVENL